MSSLCTSVSKNSLISVEENKRKITFRNPDKAEYSITAVDGCLINDGQRCDFLVSKEESVTALIELKGRNVEHACDQLDATASHDNVKPLLRGRLGFVIVCSKYPKFDTYVAKAKDRFAKRYRAHLQVFCDQRVVDIDQLVRPGR